MLIKESFVYTLPGNPNNPKEFRWVACNGDGCGYERTNDDHTLGTDPLLRMFKVDGVQMCEGCLKDWWNEIEEVL